MRSTIRYLGLELDRNFSLVCRAPIRAVDFRSHRPRARECSDARVGWGTLAPGNAGLAQGKNRSGLNFFLISLLLGPLATFLLVALFPKLNFSEVVRVRRDRIVVDLEDGVS